MLTPSNVLGARLGAYEVQTAIGSGGMATVYRAFDHNLQRPVALKVLSDAAASQPGFAERFRQEARLIARLRHPNIVHVYDFGQVDQVVYMVQELLPGPTLAERLTELAARDQPMPRREILAVVQQLAAALDTAHAAGIIHRDVKPSNVLYNADGALVLTDFGIAKTAVAEATRTQTGMVLGTPAYIAPEQARGEVLTPASDIYALGVVVYELISGRPPFEGPTPLGVVLKHLNEAPPPLQALRPSIPAAVEGVVQRALAKQADERYPTAGVLAQAFEHSWPGPLAPAAARSEIHIAPTTAWTRPAAGVNGAAPQPVAPRPGALRATGAVNVDGAATPPANSLRSGSHKLMLLAGALLLVLAGGTILAMRGDERLQTGDDTTRPAAVSEPAGAASTPPVAALRAELSASPALAAQVDAVEQALAAGDTASAQQTLSGLQRQILQARRADVLSDAQMRTSLTAIDALATQQRLTLPLSIASP